jgi:hypothetical protein
MGIYWRVERVGLNIHHNVVSRYGMTRFELSAIQDITVVRWKFAVTSDLLPSKYYEDKISAGITEWDSDIPYSIIPRRKE